MQKRLRVKDMNYRIKSAPKEQELRTGVRSSHYTNQPNLLLLLTKVTDFFHVYCVLRNILMHSFLKNEEYNLKYTSAQHVMHAQHPLPQFV
jgi:hypothetical protein